MKNKTLILVLHSLIEVVTDCIPNLEKNYIINLYSKNADTCKNSLCNLKDSYNLKRNIVYN